MSEDVIIVEDLNKDFPIQRDRPGFKEFIVNAPRYLRGNSEKFRALKGVSFTVKKGECLGVIGPNGAGKSTLLSILLGTVRPTSGKVEIMGRKTPLLELGAGFHPDMTGLENIVMNGVLLGLTRSEIEKKMDAIVDFSGLGDFVRMPARTYSNGMYLRLAFSVAISTDPEVLLIDEILAVGDEAFQKKSGAALMELIQRGVTTVFVSHSMEAVKKICGRVVWLEQGEIKGEGDPEKVIGTYLGSR
jgi:lipopolysaccharide transport system ATP-binding protein